MPSNGLPFWICRRIGSTRFLDRSVFTASANAPIPGRTIFSALWISSGRDTICALESLLDRPQVPHVIIKNGDHLAKTTTSTRRLDDLEVFGRLDPLALSET